MRTTHPVIARSVARMRAFARRDEAIHLSWLSYPSQPMTHPRQIVMPAKAGIHGFPRARQTHHTKPYPNLSKYSLQLSL
jgi:hypothetical protein